MITEIKEDLLKESIKNSEKPILIDFYATWCGPCKISDPWVKEISEKYSDSIEFYKVNVDSNPELIDEYGIRNIPAFILLEGGEIKNKLVGMVNREKLENLISEYTN
jgi:thioredoxin 1